MTTVIFTPSSVFAVRQGRLGASTVNIIHPNGARSWPKVSVLRSSNSRPTVQLLTNHCCIVHTPVVITHGAPLAPVFHLHSPSTAPATIRQPHLRSTFEHQHEAGQESAKPQHWGSGGTPYLGQVRGARVGAHSPLGCPQCNVEVPSGHHMPSHCTRHLFLPQWPHAPHPYLPSPALGTRYSPAQHPLNSLVYSGLQLPVQTTCPTTIQTHPHGFLSCQGAPRQIRGFPSPCPLLIPGVSLSVGDTLPSWGQGSPGLRGQ